MTTDRNLESLTWRGFILTTDEDGVYRTHAPGAPFPISASEVEDGWVAAVGGWHRVVFGKDHEEALNRAAADTLRRATVEIERWSKLSEQIGRALA